MDKIISTEKGVVAVSIPSTPIDETLVPFDLEFFALKNRAHNSVLRLRVGLVSTYLVLITQGLLIALETVIKETDASRATSFSDAIILARLGC